MINTITDTIKNMLGLNKEQEVCFVDDIEAPLKECGPSHFSHGYSPYGNIPQENRYTGIPAPVVLPDDPWFGPSVKSEKQLTHEEMLEEAERREENNRQELTKEPENIHQLMYEMATQNAATTLQLNPIGGSENFQGGSENVHR